MSHAQNVSRVVDEALGKLAELRDVMSQAGIAVPAVAQQARKRRRGRPMLDDTVSIERIAELHDEHGLTVHAAAMQVASEHSEPNSTLSVAQRFARVLGHARQCRLCLADGHKVDTRGASKG